MIHPNAFQREKLVATKEQVRELFEMLKEGVTSVVESNPGGVAPMLGITTYDPFEDKIEHTIAALMVDDFSSNLGKKRTMKMMAAHTFNNQKVPLAVGLVSEAWMVEAGKDYEAWRKKHLMVSADPNRFECVQVSAQNFHGPKTERIAIMDCRRLGRVSGKEEDGPVKWDGDWKGHDKDGCTPECNILDQFLQAYVDFVFKREDPQAYLGNAHVMEAPVR